MSAEPVPGAVGGDVTDAEIEAVTGRRQVFVEGRGGCRWGAWSTWRA